MSGVSFLRRGKVTLFPIIKQINLQISKTLSRAATVARKAVVGGTRQTGWGSAMWHSGARGVAAGD